MKSCFLNAGLRLSKALQREKMNHGFWLFLRTPAGSWAVSYTDLPHPLPTPHLWLPHPHSHSPPYAPILAPTAPDASHSPIIPLIPSFLVEACSLSRYKSQEGITLTCLIHCRTPGTGPGQWQGQKYLSLDGGMLMSSGSPILRQRTSRPAVLSAPGMQPSSIAPSDSVAHY